MPSGRAYGLLFGDASESEPSAEAPNGGYGPYADGYRFPPGAPASPAPTPADELDGLVRSLDPKSYLETHPWESPEAVAAAATRRGLKPKVEVTAIGDGASPQGPFKPPALDAASRDMLARIMIGEAGIDGDDGERAIGSVIFKWGKRGRHDPSRRHDGPTSI